MARLASRTVRCGVMVWNPSGTGFTLSVMEHPPAKESRPTNVKSCQENGRIYLAWRSASRSLGLRNLLESTVDMQPQVSADAHHLIGASRGAPDPKHSIARFQKPNRNGMKNFIERLVADLLRPGQFDKREREPLAKYGNMPGAENRQRVRLHLLNIF